MQITLDAKDLLCVGDHVCTRPLWCWTRETGSHPQPLC